MVEQSPLRPLFGLLLTHENQRGDDWGKNTETPLPPSCLAAWPRLSPLLKGKRENNEMPSELKKPSASEMKKNWIQQNYWVDKLKCLDGRIGANDWHLRCFFLLSRFFDLFYLILPILALLLRIRPGCKCVWKGIRTFFVRRTATNGGWKWRPRSMRCKKSKK